MKRRRLEAREEAHRRGEESPPTNNNNNNNNNNNTSPPSAATKTKSKETPLDIKASLRERRAAADQARTRDEETLRQDIADVDIEALRNLAVVEEFDVLPRRSLRSQHTRNGEGENDSNNERWKAAWNGRKNFKKFRPQGSGNGAAGAARRGGAQGVIVPLEEVKKKDFGIGEEYWLEGGKESLKRKRKERESQSMSQSQMPEHEDESLSLGASTNGRDRFRGNGRKNIPKELVVDDDEEMPDMVDVEAPRRTRGMDTQTQRSSAGRTSQARGKQQQPKRSFAAKQEESDSEEDELKFRFGKRRRMQQ
ncbi:MAG: hypothetical protein Q9196_007358 [Gyalolechia fulgens]